MYGLSNYDTAKMLVKASRPRLVQNLREACAASYNTNAVFMYVYTYVHIYVTHAHMHQHIYD
jgi:hypothetical protein